MILIIGTTNKGIVQSVTFRRKFCTFVFELYLSSMKIYFIACIHLHILLQYNVKHKKKTIQYSQRYKNLSVFKFPDFIEQHSFILDSGLVEVVSFDRRQILNWDL